ncbi:hypothetical protein FRC07_007093 [Ceratobasidium sp. 392]|nr:hypothetical protein FRC07_007093 [Ceratobasidium sp. 392]
MATKRGNRGPPRARIRTRSHARSVSDQAGEDMAIDSDDEQFIPTLSGFSDILAGIRDTPAPELAPLSTPIASASPISHSHLLKRLGREIADTTPETFVKLYPDVALAWSKYTRRILFTLLRPLEDKKMVTSPSPELAGGLTSLRHSLIHAVNLVDKVSEAINDFPIHHCPDVCAGSVTPVPSNSPLPPVVPAFADAAATSGPSVSPVALPNPLRSPVLDPLPPILTYTPGPFIPVPFTSYPLPARPVAAVNAPRLSRADKGKQPTSSSYARAVAPLGRLVPPKSAGAPTATPHSRSARTQPSVANKPPSRLVVCFGGHPPAKLRASAPTEPFRLVKLALELHPTIHGVTLLGAHWNKTGNIVLSFPFGTPESTLSSLIPAVRAALRIEDSVQISRDVPWSKLMVSSVIARDRQGSPTYSESSVYESLLLNPAFSDLVTTRPPRWVRNPNSITKAHSSLTFSFEDANGSIARSLLRTPLFIFGAPVSLKRWDVKHTDKPATRFARVPQPEGGPAPTDRSSNEMVTE